jgi:hypothetical protein
MNAAVMSAAVVHRELEFRAALESPELDAVREHPYLSRFRRAELSAEHVGRVWLTQQAHLSRSFGSCLATLLVKLPDSYVDERRELLQVLHHEVWDPSRLSGHSRLLARLYAAFNRIFDPQHLDEPLPCTLAFIRARQEAIASGSPLDALGVLAANEHVNANENGSAGIMVAYFEGLTRMKVSPEGRSYVRVHVQEEAQEVDLLLRMAGRFAAEKRPTSDGVTQTPPLESFANGVRQLCRQRMAFFDGLVDAIGPNGIRKGSA